MNLQQEVDLSKTEHQPLCNKEVAHKNGNLCGFEVAYYGIQEYERGRIEVLQEIAKELPHEIAPETRGDRMRQRWNNGFNKCVVIVEDVIKRHSL